LEKIIEKPLEKPPIPPVSPPIQEKPVPPGLSLAELAATKTETPISKVKPPTPEVKPVVEEKKVEPPKIPPAAEGEVGAPTAKAGGEEEMIDLSKF
jgi:hypothetical protein